MKKLDNLRRKIDQIDNQLLTVLQKRFEIVCQIGKLKKEIKLPPLQPQRWKEVVRARLKTAETMGLRKKFIRELFDLIHQESLDRQK